jgi:hypothetical protein
MKNIDLTQFKGFTPGPWAWFGWNARRMRNDMSLSTTHSGRYTIMDFVRAGTQGALPRFRISLDPDYDDNWKNKIMSRCDDIGEEVDHNGQYTLTQPDAKLIAAAPEILEYARELEAENKRLREALGKLRREHLVFEDPEYSCPLAIDWADVNDIRECDCGADEHNAIIDEALKEQE